MRWIRLIFSSLSSQRELFLAKTQRSQRRRRGASVVIKGGDFFASFAPLREPRRANGTPASAATFRAMAQSPRKPWWRRWFGTRSERAAARFLKNLGCKVLARNFSCQLGELDLVVLDKNCIVFVEVRSTEGEDQSMPAQSVDHFKQKRLTRLA